MAQLEVRHPKARRLPEHKHTASPIFEEGSIRVFELTGTERPVSRTLQCEAADALVDMAAEKREAIVRAGYNVMLTPSLSESGEAGENPTGRVLADRATRTLWVAPDPKPLKADPFLSDDLVRKREAVQLQRQLSEAVDFITKEAD